MEIGKVRISKDKGQADIESHTQANRCKRTGIENQRRSHLRERQGERERERETRWEC